MNDAITTWGELCVLAGIETGKTPENSPVHKIISGGFVATAPASRHLHMPVLRPLAAALVCVARIAEARFCN